MNKLEALAAKLYCIRTAGNYNFPVELDDLVKQMGREVAMIPYSQEQEQEDKQKFITISREELLFVHKAIEEALATPQDELLPYSVTQAETLLWRILSTPKVD